MKLKKFEAVLCREAGGHRLGWNVNGEEKGREEKDEVVADKSSFRNPGNIYLS